MGAGGIHSHSFYEKYNKVFNGGIGGTDNTANLRNWTTQYLVVARGFPVETDGNAITSSPVALDYVIHKTVTARPILGGSPSGIQVNNLITVNDDSAAY